MKVKVKRLHPGAAIPQYATGGAACFDLHAIVDTYPPYGQDAMAVPEGAATFRTGLAFEIPAGHVMLIFSRSGHGFKHDTRLANCVGVIDSDYRGEVMVRLTRDDPCPLDILTVRHGDRIAQAMILPVPTTELIETEQLDETDRGTGGFGSTGQ